MNKPNRGLTPFFGTPRTRCDHDRAPLWCLMLGGIPVTEWLMTLQMAAAQTASYRSEGDR
jgi:hypothetical protein